MITVKNSNDSPLTFGSVKEGDLFCANTYTNDSGEYKHIFLKLVYRGVDKPNAVWITHSPGTLCTIENERLVKLVNAQMEILM